MLAGAAPEILGNDPRLFGKLLAAAARLGLAHSSGDRFGSAIICRIPHRHPFSFR
jgi:hypothetical protein